MPCVNKETENSKEWLDMVVRFRNGSPRKGESFSVVRQVIEKDGNWYALESIGSTYVTKRMSVATRCESESQARKELGI